MRIAELSWEEYAKRASTHIFVLPIGAIEAHGPHLPLATDTVVASYLADRLGAELETLTLPALSYGYQTDPIRAGGEFPGVTNLRAGTLSDLVLDILSASYRNGGRTFLLLHGHIANVPVVYDAAARFSQEAPGARVMLASWWDFALEETRDAIAEETGVPRTQDHHAAQAETSLMLHMSPQSVRRSAMGDDRSSRRARYVVLPAPDALKTRSGIVYTTGRASAEIGRRITEEVVRNMIAAVKLELQ